MLYHKPYDSLRHLEDSRLYRHEQFYLRRHLEVQYLYFILKNNVLLKQNINLKLATLILINLPFCGLAFTYMASSVLLHSALYSSVGGLQFPFGSQKSFGHNDLILSDADLKIENVKVCSKC